jgi:hypothetical protein
LLAGLAMATAALVSCPTTGATQPRVPGRRFTPPGRRLAPGLLVPPGRRANFVPPGQREGGFVPGRPPGQRTGQDPFIPSGHRGDPFFDTDLTELP